MRAIVRGIPSSYEKGLAEYFGTGPTDIEEARSQHKSYVAKLRELGVTVKEIEPVSYTHLTLPTTPYV